ncbi:MAG: alpha/beta fold hydrolase [Deltaproteobacteria bacterium]|nr:alpha/beta fold hydrolase [Deltaproteobacteria bacterium]
MPEVTVRGRRLGYEARPQDFERSGLSVVFIHGTGGDREDWRAQLDGLWTVANMIAIELPGHGQSEPPGESSVDAYARWVGDFVETLGLERVMLFGCSLGSAIAQWIALQSPSWLEALGVVGGGARLRVHPAFLDGVLQDSEKAMKDFAAFAVASQGSEAVLNETLRKFMRNPASLIHGDLTACNEFDVMERVAEIVVPTLIVVGEEDRLTPPKYARYLHDRIAHSSLNVISAAGHVAMMEKPEEFNRVLADFVKRLGRR